MAEAFVICTRPSTRKGAKSSEKYYFAWYRDPVTGAKLSKNRFSVDTLAMRLNTGGIRGHITSKAQAYKVAQEALDRGLVFGFEKPTTPRLIAFIEGYWDYNGSYVKKRLAEGYSITENYVTIIRSVTGHSSVSMTLHYLHETAENLKAQAEARSTLIQFSIKIGHY